MTTISLAQFIAAAPIPLDPICNVDLMTNIHEISIDPFRCQLSSSDGRITYEIDHLFGLTETITIDNIESYKRYNTQSRKIKYSRTTRINNKKYDDDKYHLKEQLMQIPSSILYNSDGIIWRVGYDNNHKNKKLAGMSFYFRNGVLARIKFGAYYKKLTDGCRCLRYQNGKCVKMLKGIFSCYKPHTEKTQKIFDDLSSQNLVSAITFEKEHFLKLTHNIIPSTDNFIETQITLMHFILFKINFNWLESDQQNEDEDDGSVTSTTNDPVINNSVTNDPVTNTTNDPNDHSVHVSVYQDAT